MKIITHDVEFDDFLLYVDNQELGEHASYFLLIDIVCCCYLPMLYFSLGFSVLLAFQEQHQF